MLPDIEGTIYNIVNQNFQRTLNSFNTDVTDIYQKLQQMHDHNKLVKRNNITLTLYSVNTIALMVYLAA